MSKVARKHWERLKRSLSRRYREWRLPRGYVRLGTKYGGWWVDRRSVTATPLLLDCGLGVDISFPMGFLAMFGGRVIGIDPNPRSLEYCRAHLPAGMEIVDKAFWVRAGETLSFHLPRSVDELPKGADGVSGSLLGSHSYAGGGEVQVVTTDFDEVLRAAGREECDALKLDIEGAEYEVLAELCRNGAIRRARQLMVEYHHHCTEHSVEDTLRSVNAICASGFRVVHREDRNYVFRRVNLV
jgi:FkbM family methyltransferase